MRALPSEFRGVRSPQEAEDDLRALTKVGGVFVLVDPDDGPAQRQSGPVEVRAESPGRLTVSVRDLSFDFDLDLCRGAWLSTYDGTTYFGLSVDLGWACVVVSDANR